MSPIPTTNNVRVINNNSVDSGFSSNFSHLTSSIDMPNDTCIDKPVKRKRIRRRVVKLSEIAIKILVSWYERNYEHPYPTHDAIQVLATAGNITVEQVQKWFSNRRMRDKNTKPLPVIAARRKRLIIDDTLYSDVKRVCY